jgi:asparagine synthase (glutamine-hydrolysing)
LVKLDRCLMAHGVEGRTPLLDIELAKFAFRLPQELKIRNRRGKYLMRQWLAKHMPDANSLGRKRGFTTPVADWIATEGERLAPLVAADPGVAEVAFPEKAKALFTSGQKQHREAAWRLLFYALWHRRHIRGRPAEGDVFECLASP